MWTWLRWLLLALLVYYIVVFPQEAAQLTQAIVGGAVRLFVGAADAAATFLQSL
ncbi:MAG TPA: hypothetical protein VK923_16095 [Euzebyales bacterium]|nr:hypothetical protein [Euzebyales bacterium]